MSYRVHTKAEHVLVIVAAPGIVSTCSCQISRPREYIRVDTGVDLCAPRRGRLVWT